jgi:hypothetical protein
MHRHLEALNEEDRLRNRKRRQTVCPEPTLDDVRRDYEPRPVNQQEEVTELVGMCLWDIFSDNHEVIARDGRLADLGTFRGASAFLDEYLTVDPNSLLEGDDGRFYMGTIWVRNRADLTPVYAMVFRRLHALGADWVYHFPELHLVELGPLDDPERSSKYSVTKSAAAALKADQDRAEVERMRRELAAIHVRAREEAMDRLPPATVRAYRRVYGRGPRGWPPASEEGRSCRTG